MTDKELLELAAKAAGLPVGSDQGEYQYRKGGTWTAGLYATDNGYPLFWNSLIDDRDALRLAAALPGDVEIRICGGSVSVSINAASEMPVYVHQKQSDPTEALRRAITRAAARIACTTDT